MTEQPTDRPPYAVREVGAVVLVQALVLLAMAPFYGPHPTSSTSSRPGIG